MKMAGYAAVAVAALLLGIFIGGQQWNRGQTSDGELPSHAPAFELLDLNGTAHRLSDYQGQWLLINFWATWCVPCRKEMPRLEAAYQQYRDQGLTILGPAIDETPAVIAYLEATQISYPIVVGGENLFALMDGLGDHLGALPFTVFLGPDGKILERHWGELDNAMLQNMIELHLGRL